VAHGGEQRRCANRTQGPGSAPVEDAVRRVQGRTHLHVLSRARRVDEARSGALSHLCGTRECRSYAEADEDIDGYWGGTSGKQRRHGRLMAGPDPRSAPPPY